MSYIAPDFLIASEEQLTSTVDRLIIPTLVPGQYQVVASAPSANHSESHYVAHFMRDTAYFMLGLVEAIENGATHLMPRLHQAITSLEVIERYQIDKDDPVLRLKPGQMPHELRFPSDPMYPFFIESNWHIFKNGKNGREKEYIASYDTSEGTHLYVMLVMRLEKLLPGFISENENRMKAVGMSCGYMLDNSDDHGGHAGFVNDLPWSYLKSLPCAEAFGPMRENDTDFPNSVRKHYGAAFRSIRDEGLQAGLDGMMPKPGCPISEFQTTALKYATELMAADFWRQNGNKDLAALLKADAERTKILVNDPEKGFLSFDKAGNPFMAEFRATHPLTGKVEKNPYKTSMALYALSHPYIDEQGKPHCVIDKDYLPGIAHLLSQDLYREGFGIATYSDEQEITLPKGMTKRDKYWISAGETAWGIEQHLAALGLMKFNFVDEGTKILKNALEISKDFGGSLENWLGIGSGIKKWQKEDGQTSGAIMAFVTGPGLAAIAHYKSLRDNYTLSPDRSLIIPTAVQKNLMLSVIK